MIFLALPFCVTATVQELLLEVLGTYSYTYLPTNDVIHFHLVMPAPQIQFLMLVEISGMKYSSYDYASFTI